MRMRGLPGPRRGSPPPYRHPYALPRQVDCDRL